MKRQFLAYRVLAFGRRLTMTAPTRGAAAAVILLALTAAAPAQLTQIEPIPLASGVNRIERFAADGREAIVTLGWRDNGNAWGYSLYQVMMPDSPGGRSWNVVGIERPDASGAEATFEDAVRDMPHTGEDTVRSVRFARALVDGAPATLLLTATRQLDGPVPDPAPVLAEAFRLTPGDDVGVTHDYFARILQTRLPLSYCNSEVALSQAFGMALRPSYEGPQTKDGCDP